MFSCRLTWQYSIGSRLVFRISFLLLIGTPPCSSLAFPGLMGSLKILRRVLPRTLRTGCGTPDSWGSTSPSPNSLASVLPSVSLQWKSLRVLSETWHSVFTIGRERKLLKRLQENIEKIMMLNKRRRWFHSPRVKLTLVSMSASWFLVSTYLILDLGF